MENNEFERSGSDVRKNKGSRPAGRLKRVFTVIAIAVITMALIFSVAGCGEEENKDDNATPGITVPETPADPSADTDDPSADTDDPSADEDDPIIDPDDPVIDPDDPVIDPDDPVIDPDPENPGEDIPPEDIPPEDVPPEDVPPEDKPPEEENPDQEDPSTEIPGSIDEVDEVDEIKYFADEFTQILNENYMDDLAKQFIGRNGTADDISSTEWMITNSNNNDQIKELQVKVYYDYSNTKHFKVGKVTFNKAYSIQDIISGNASDYTLSVPLKNTKVSYEDLKNNTDLGKTIIQAIDADNTLEGDIWCSIGSASPSNGKTYRPITVYQITENGVEEYYMVAEAPSADPASIVANIQEGRYTTTSQSTEYTFAGEKIKQGRRRTKHFTFCL